MDPLYAALARLDAFAAVPEEALRASLPLWRVVNVKPGKVLWKQGRAADEIGLVHLGELDVVVHGTAISTVGPGTMIGEAAIFVSGASRRASLRASRPTQVLTLPSTALRQLDAAGSPLYDAILWHAIRTTASRCRALDLEISRIRKSNFAVRPPPEPTGFLARLWQRVRGPEPHAVALAPLAELFARHPALAHADPAIHARLAAAFVARPFRGGEVICRHGEVEDRVYVLAAGRADVLRIVEGSGNALLVARFEAGTIFGVHAFVEGGQRTASIVATEDGWVYAMDRATFDGLPADARRRWMEAILAVLVGQGQAASEALEAAIQVFTGRDPALMVSGAQPGVEGAWGALQGLRPGDPVPRLGAGKRGR